MDSPAKIQEVLITPELLGKAGDALALIEKLVDLIRNITKLPDLARNFRCRQCAARLRHLQRKQIQCRQLSCERLRRSDADLRAGVGIDNRVRLTCRLT